MGGLGLCAAMDHASAAFACWVIASQDLKENILNMAAEECPLLLPEDLLHHLSALSGEDVSILSLRSQTQKMVSWFFITFIKDRLSNTLYEYQKGFTPSRSKSHQGQNIKKTSAFSSFLQSYAVSKAHTPSICIDGSYEHDVSFLNLELVCLVPLPAMNGKRRAQKLHSRLRGTNTVAAASSET